MARKEDSLTIVVPPVSVLLAAIKELAQRYSIGTWDEQETKRALHVIKSAAQSAMHSLGHDFRAQDELRDAWDILRVDQGTAGALQDPQLRLLDRRLDGLRISIKNLSPKPGSETDFHFNFEFFCEECGGYLMEIPDHPVEDDVAKCSACGHEFGRYGDVRELCRWKADQELKRLRLGAYS